MRQIKFRAWDKELKMMVYSKEQSGHIEYDANPVDVINTILNYDDYGLEYMQYTGLNDKNGKEIYEGDIVKYPDASRCGESYDYDNYENIGVVKYDSDSLCYYFTNRETVDMDDINITEDVEVMGNIYENKEKEVSEAELEEGEEE